MGLLSQGRPLDWDETKRYAKYVRERGIAQFINIYNESKDRADACFKWGDEVEYILVKFDHKKRAARVSLRAEEVFQKISEQTKGKTGPRKSFWNPEFAAYMVEGTPGIPYIGDGLLLTSLCDIEDNMKYRRQEVMSVLDSDETVMSITSFPRLGCPDFTHPPSQPKPETSASGSIFFPDEAIYNGHPRFKTLVKNIRSRRRRKVAINLPIYHDIHTPNPFREAFTNEEARKASKPNHVYMDAMGFGMGCCCLQITLQATHLEEARVLYDQLAPLTPISLALSAASPIYRGLLTDRDCRWEVISCSVDDRTREESGETREMKESMYRIPKSRYDSISCYISRNGQKYNDVPLVFDKSYHDLMVANKVDPAVARHIAHLFIRDPITLYKEKLEQSDAEMDHFENIQSTNWQTMRFKPPPSVDSPIGWRVEFRPFEAQTSDFENAAFVVFITLLSRVILAYKLNFMMPISMIDENMIEAQKRDAVKNSKFWFRADILHRSSSKEPLSTVLENCNNTANNASHHHNDHLNHQNNLSLSASQINANNQAATNLASGTNGNNTTTNAASAALATRSSRIRPSPHRHHNLHHHNHHHHHHHHHYNNISNVHHNHHHNYHQHLNNNHLSSIGGHHKHHSHHFDSNHRHSRLATTSPIAASRVPFMANPAVGPMQSQDGTMIIMNGTNLSNNAGGLSTGTSGAAASTDRDLCVKMTIDEIINGREGFVGIMPIVSHYVESFDDGTNTELITRIKRYLKLVSDRASAKVKTTARVIRDFVDVHPKYNHDSVVNDEVAYDLLQFLNKIGNMELIHPELTGEPVATRMSQGHGRRDDSPRIRSHSSNGFISPAPSLSKRNNSP